MLGRLAAVAVAIALAGCAGLEPAGRNADRSPRATQTASAPAPRVTPPPQPPAPTVTTPPVAAAPAPAATRTAPTPAPAPQQTQPPVAAPQVTAPTPASTPARQQSDGDDIVVPGQVRTQVPPPQGDPRSNEERRADVRAWDQCVMQVQSAFESDPMSAQLTTPEEYCATSLGMAERMSVPISRQQQRRR